MCREAGRQALDVIRPAQRIDHAVNTRLFTKNQLGVACDVRGEIGWQSKRLIKAVGMQRLRPTEYGGQRLDGCSHDIVIRVLTGQTDT